MSIQIWNIIGKEQIMLDEDGNVPIKIEHDKTRLFYTGYVYLNDNRWVCFTRHCCTYLGCKSELKKHLKEVKNGSNGDIKTSFSKIKF